MNLKANDRCLCQSWSHYQQSRGSGGHGDTQASGWRGVYECKQKQEIIPLSLSLYICVYIYIYIYIYIFIYIIERERERERERYSGTAL